jgi:hypothetical protein
MMEAALEMTDLVEFRVRVPVRVEKTLEMMDSILVNLVLHLVIRMMAQEMTDLVVEEEVQGIAMPLVLFRARLPVRVEKDLEMMDSILVNLALHLVIRMMEAALEMTDLVEGEVQVIVIPLVLFRARLPVRVEKTLEMMDSILVDLVLHLVIRMMEAALEMAEVQVIAIPLVLFRVRLPVRVGKTLEMMDSI